MSSVISRSLLREWSGNLRFPERRLDTEFVCGLDEDAQVVAEDLRQHFVRLRDRRFGADTTAELRLDHVERRFDV